jgi:hypothetical protein
VHRQLSRAGKITKSEPDVRSLPTIPCESPGIRWPGGGYRVMAQVGGKHLSVDIAMDRELFCRLVIESGNGAGVEYALNMLFRRDPEGLLRILEGPGLFMRPGWTPARARECLPPDLLVKMLSRADPHYRLRVIQLLGPG